MLRTTIPRLARSSPFSHATRSLLRPSPSRPFTQRSLPAKPIPQRSSAASLAYAQSILRRLFHSSRARLAAEGGAKGGAGAAEESLTLGQRMKKLGREYGWAGVGVYAGLCIIDLPFCYLFVKTMGTDRIGEWEHKVIESVKSVIPESVSSTWHEWTKSMKKVEHEIIGTDDISEGVEMAGWGVEEAEKQNKAEASLATQLALAYAIHKTFIFIRVPIAVAITPKVVKVLRGWGWDIGKRTTKEAKAIKRAAMPPKK